MFEFAYFFIQGMRAAIPPRINDAEFQRLNNEAIQLGAIKREYIAHVLHPHN